MAITINRETDANNVERRSRAPPLPLRWLRQERGRWFLWAPVCFSAGISAYFALPVEPHILILVLAGVIAAALHKATRAWSIVQPVTIALILVAAGLLTTKVRTIWVAAPILERTLYAAKVDALVEYIQPRNDRGPRVTMIVRRIERLPLHETPHRVRVRFQRPIPNLRPGHLISFKATLTPPAPPALPGGYDFGRAAYYQSLGAVGFAIGRPTISPPPEDTGVSLMAKAAIQTWRQQIGVRITNVLPGQTGAIAMALMTGERGRVERATLEAYRDAGLLHLLSISGLHMAIMAGSVFLALRFVLASFPTLALNIAIKKWTAVVAIVAAFGYLMISGSTHATIRACIMVTIMMVAVILDRPGLALRNVAIAGMLILMTSPESLLHAGFQMSFAAVIALIAFYEIIQKRRSHAPSRPQPGWFSVMAWFLLGIIGSTVIASIAVAPIAAFHFHKSQQFAVLANLIAVPVCNLIVMPAALLAFLSMPFGLESLPLLLMGQGIEVMTWCAEQVAALPGAVARLPAFSTVAFGFIVMGGLWLCLWQLSWRWLGLVWITIGIALAPYHQRPSVLVGREGRLVAVRSSDGTLAVIQGRRTKFELEQWLAHDGDNRRPTDIRSKAGFRCDRKGCTAPIQGKPLAVSLHPASLQDDCERSAILILPYPVPNGCTSDRLMVWDFWSMRKLGTHAYFAGEGGEARLHTVADARGNRPWSRRHFQSPRTNRRPRIPRNSDRTSERTRLGRFAASQLLRPDVAPYERPDDEGDTFAFDRQ